MSLVADKVEHGETVAVGDDCFAVDQERPRRQGGDAATMIGKRLVKSLPLRVISRTPAVSRRARMRKPSCLISCSQPGPEGGALAGDGKHGSIIPSPGRVRSRNDMRA